MKLFLFLQRNILHLRTMNPSDTSILLIYTGGTIGMIENPETGALENFNFEQLQKHVSLQR